MIRGTLNESVIRGCSSLLIPWSPTKGNTYPCSDSGAGGGLGGGDLGDLREQDAGVDRLLDVTVRVVVAEPVEVLLEVLRQGVLDAGVAFIQKPFSLADMTEKVQNILDSASNKN